MIYSSFRTPSAQSVTLMNERGRRLASARRALRITLGSVNNKRNASNLVAVASAHRPTLGGPMDLGDARRMPGASLRRAETDKRFPVAGAATVRPARAATHRAAAGRPGRLVPGGPDSG